MTKEEDLKQRLAAVLKDLRDGGTTDVQAMMLVGSLASDLTDQLGQKTWTAAKQAMSTAQYDEMLASFQTRGNDLYQKGQTKPAYAIQMLGISLVCSTQRRDADLAAGEKLLDDIINRAVALYRQRRTTN